MIDILIVIKLRFLFRLTFKIPTDPGIGPGDNDGFKTETIERKY